MLPADERFETFRDAEAIGHALGALGDGDERGFRARDVV